MSIQAANAKEHEILPKMVRGFRADTTFCSVGAKDLKSGQFMIVYSVGAYDKFPINRKAIIF